MESERNYTQIGLIEVGATAPLGTLQPSDSQEVCSWRTFKFNPQGRINTPYRVVSLPGGFGPSQGPPQSLCVLSSGRA